MSRLHWLIMWTIAMVVRGQQKARQRVTMRPRARTRMWNCQHWTLVMQWSSGSYGHPILPPRRRSARAFAAAAAAATDTAEEAALGGGGAPSLVARDAARASCELCRARFSANSAASLRRICTTPEPVLENASRPPRAFGTVTTME